MAASKDNTTRQVTGHQIKQSIKRWELRKQIADKQFKESIYTFKDEKKGLTPQAIGKNYKEADAAIAYLEELRQQYNRYVRLKVGGQEMTLSLAVKLYGGAGRMEKMWRLACVDEQQDRYNRYDGRTRQKDAEYATRRVTVEEAMKQADIAAIYAGDLRAAIAEGNGTKFTVPSEFPGDLFE